MSERCVVLVDGPSGSGKTTYARRLAEETGMALVHLDDFYPGWGGLAEGSRMVAEDVLHPRRPGFWRWDWVHDRRAEWVPLDPTESVIVEGAGAVTADSIAAASRVGRVRTVRITAPERVRKERALRRDPDYAPWWKMWAAQEAVHFAGPGRVAVDEESSN